VTVVFFGEGAVAEGEFHESMNLAALWGLPVLFCCENNLYAMGTALERSESQTQLTLKAASYQMPAWQVDGMDVKAVEEAAAKAVESVRGGGGPHFLELRTYRFRRAKWRNGRAETRSRPSATGSSRRAWSRTRFGPGWKQRSATRSTLPFDSPRPGPGSRSRT
jgi:TPP-dependent pyruvate/acetoin dehydrogenase alpha subunit